MHVLLERTNRLARNLPQLARDGEQAAADGASAYPMGPTSVSDRPGESWHPVHAEVAGGELQACARRG